MLILESGEACRRYLYYCVRYDAVMYFIYKSYMGGFLAALTAGYEQSIIIWA